jgi:iron complex transport system substrate-binding protein
LISPLRRLTLSYVPVAFAAVISLLSSCTAEPPQQQAQRLHSDRYISMAPSNTELLYALHADNNLVGVCNQCDYPGQVKQKPTMGTFTTVDLEKTLQIKPDTAFLVEGQEALADTISKQPALHCQPIVLQNRHVRDVTRNLSNLAALTGHSKEAQPLRASFLKRLDELVKIIGGSRTPATKVFFCVWPEPLTTVGTASYLNEAITICGGENIAGKLPAAYPQFNTEQILAVQPEVIILPHEAEGQTFLHNPPWTSLQAVANKRVYYLPARDDDRLSRPTLRLIDGLYWLAERLHPELAEKIRAETTRSRSQG